MKIKTEIFDLNSQKNKSIFKNVIFPIQTHSSNIVEIKTGKENLKNCDGIFTSSKNQYSLGVTTADCAAISFSDDQKYGVIHAGWRGLVNGIIEKMLDKFNNPNIFVSSLLKEFEIKKDDCHKKIENKFGEKYFVVKKEEDKEVIIFQFQKAIKDILPENAIFDSKDTFENKNLASWRRDGKIEGNFTIISNNARKSQKS